MENLRGAHPAVDLIMRHRAIAKLKGTYVDALPALINEKTKRVHTTFTQTIAATGRLSSNDPNLQNIPVRTGYGNRIRQAFIARDIGKDPMLLAADYSQIELRIMAHLSQDPALIAAFQGDEDIHAATAASVFGVPLDEVTSEQRRRAKVFNFGVLYGLSEFGLSTRERISREEAAEFIRRYFEKYANVRAWRDGAIESCRTLGYGETLMGRRRYIPEIKSPNFQIRSSGERMAINMPVQGTASDIIKVAMNRIDAEITERGMIVADDPAGARRADLRGAAVGAGRGAGDVRADHAEVDRHGGAAEDRRKDGEELGGAGGGAGAAGGGGAGVRGGGGVSEYARLDIVPVWSRLNDGLIKLVDYIPDDKMNWSPKPELWNFRGILLHIASARDIWMGTTVKDGVDAPDVWRTVRSKDEIKEAFRRTRERLDAILARREQARGDIRRRSGAGERSLDRVPPAGARHPSSGGYLPLPGAAWDRDAGRRHAVAGVRGYRS